MRGQKDIVHLANASDVPLLASFQATVCLLRMSWCGFTVAARTAIPWHTLKVNQRVFILWPLHESYELWHTNITRKKKKKCRCTHTPCSQAQECGRRCQWGSICTPPDCFVLWPRISECLCFPPRVKPPACVLLPLSPQANTLIETLRWLHL